MKIIFLLTLMLICFQSCNRSRGTFVDERDGNEYKWVKIGSNIWMAENLAYLPQVNSVLEASLNEERYYVLGYNGNDINEAKTFNTISWNDSLINPYEKYGVLYNWAAIVTYDTIGNKIVDDVCPAGWHIPTDQEWMNLELSIGMDPLELNALGLRTHSAPGFLLKAKYGWNNNGNGIDTLGFAALPSGEAFSGAGFLEEGEKATFWTASTGIFHSTAWIRTISCCEDGIIRIERDKMEGFSLRCIKD